MGGTFDVKSNEEQLQVIRTTESPLLVIAGPGAGKTKTLVDRVCHLIYDLNVSPENILIGTFTEKAAKELLSRISTVSANYRERWTAPFGRSRTYMCGRAILQGVPVRPSVRPRHSCNGTTVPPQGVTIPNADATS